MFILKHTLADLKQTLAKNNLKSYIFMRILLYTQKIFGFEGYVNNYFYQGYEPFGIIGAKPTIYRLNQFWDENITNKKILDIGSNVGFISCHLATLGNSVTGIELNPILNLISNYFKKVNSIKNVLFICGDFQQINFDEKYDICLSLSNHQTTDQNMSMVFSAYIQKIYNLLEPGGTLIFESHDINGPGLGLPGDDGDIINKIRIMSKYFYITKFKMIKCFLKHNVDDIDKLLLYMIKKPCIQEESLLDKKYDFKKASYDWTYLVN